MRQFIQTVRAVSVALACVFGSGCDGGDGSGLETMPPSPPPPSSENPFAAEFSEIQANVFTPTCAVSGCHQGAGAPQGLRLDEANSFDLLVNVPSSEVPSLMRVAPGDPDNSYLIQKLEGTAAVGGRMPLDSTPLDRDVIGVIRRWITEGAIDDREQSQKPIRIRSMSPVAGSEVETPERIVVMFDREVDVSTVHAKTFLLERSGGDGTFGDGNEVTVPGARITTPVMKPMRAILDLTGVAVPADSYRVQLRGSGASVILDIDANALDGEYSGMLPSGDRVGGGDFETTFTVIAGND